MRRVIILLFTLFFCFNCKISATGGLNKGLLDLHLSDSVPKLTDLINLNLTAYTVEILTFIILGIMIVMHIVRRNRSCSYGSLSLTIFTILFVAVCVLELIIAMSGINPIWFCSPNTVGWFFSVMGFFAFVYILNNQRKSFLLLMNNLPGFMNSMPTKKYLPGILSGSIGFLALCFCLFLEPEFMQTYFWGIVGMITLLQIIQAVIIYRNMRYCDKLLISIIYLIGVFALIVTLMYFMALFILAILIIVAMIALTIMAKVKESNSGSMSDSEGSYTQGSYKSIQCRFCSRFPGHAGYCDLGQRYVSDYRADGACIYYRG